MSADAVGGVAAFIPKSRKSKLYTQLYALGYSQDDVYEMDAATVLDIAGRGESKAARDARLESEAEAAEAKEALAAAAKPASPKPDPAPALQPKDAKPAARLTTPAAESEREALRILALAKSPIHPIVDAYAGARGLNPFAKPIPSGVGFVLNLEHKSSGHFLPALAFRFTGKDNAPLNAVSVVYLEPSGKSKAKFPNDGHKSTMTFGGVKGAAIRLAEAQPNKPVVLAEGPETGLTILQATGLPVWVTGGENLGNFEPPEGVAWFIIAAENDEASKKFIKKLRGRLEPAGVRIDVARPPIGTRDGPISDFNDLVNGRGVDRDTDLPFQREKGLRRIKEIFDKTIVKEEARGGGTEEVQTFSMSKHGLFRHLGNGVWDYISQPFEVLAVTRDAEIDGAVEGWGLHLRFTRDGRAVERTLSRASLHGDPSLVAGYLENAGMAIRATKAARLALVEYLGEAAPAQRMTTAPRVGWHVIGGHNVFVLPHMVIGEAAGERVILKRDISAPFAARGALDEWKERVARPAGGHRILRFAISTALAGTLLCFANGESGIIHFAGVSSKGKSTAVAVAASAWGSGETKNNGFIRSWRSTANGLEATLSSASDTFLPLDEIQQAEARETGAIVYMLANALGKGRMSRTGELRKPHWWRVIALSSGERPMSAWLGGDQPKGPRKAMAGQLIRAIDIKVPHENGVFDLYPDFDPKGFANEMQRAATSAYGTGGPEFVRCLIEKGVSSDDIRARVNAFAKEAMAGVSGDTAQIARVCDKFGLIAAAGELAAEFGVVPWEKEKAREDACALFKAWLDDWGGAGSIEERQAADQIRLFIERHGESRFDSLDPPKTNSYGDEIERRPAPDRAGWRKGEGGARRWYISIEVWKTEACAGLDPALVAKALIACNMMEADQGRITTTIWLFGKTVRVYAVTPRIFEKDTV